MLLRRILLPRLLCSLPLAVASIAVAQQKPPAPPAPPAPPPGQKQPSDPQQKPAPANPSSFERALARYRTCMARLPFRYHTEGRERLASTRVPEALQLLVDDYQKTKAYPEYSRYTMATMFGRYFDTAAAVPVLDALWKANNKAVDTWLGVQALRIHANHEDEALALDIITSSKNVTHRAAAILALGESKHGNLKTALVSACVDFPKKEGERALLIGAMSGAIDASRSRINDPEFRKGLEAYISLLAPEVGLSHTLKVQMARHLMWALNGPALFVDPESWLAMLSRGEVKKPSDNRTTAQPRFFGVETDGERFCYVVDMSDSMCKHIEPSARPENPVTGPRQRKPKGVLPDEDDLPWAKIHSRWDLAREQLKISLQRLTPDKHFAIVWFGTGSGTFEATKGLVKATDLNIARAIAELDSIKETPPEKLTAEERVKSPDGSLRGSTNMHSGIRHAFGLTDKGYLDTIAYVDHAALTEGCDTIFLLSDGAPSQDDFHIEDRDYGEGRVIVDVEYEAGVERRPPRLTYPGPYATADPLIPSPTNTDPWLVEDFKRMNAFRRIRMHCIGLGEANVDLLKRLADRCHGETYVFGKKKPKAEEGKAPPKPDDGKPPPK
ncbi:MAG: hypothetical protein FJ265_08350 [Planctomycetes bacterium]|nr:hypothetical protein [Planctomycetota bacterium]